MRTGLYRQLSLKLAEVLLHASRNRRSPHLIQVKQERWPDYEQCLTSRHFFEGLAHSRCGSPIIVLLGFTET